MLKVQRVDTNFSPSLRNPPTYRRGDGPVIWIDEAHNNIVAIKGRYEPFIAVLLKDGYVVKAFRVPFSTNSLTEVEVLVIGNALHNRNVNNWSLPTPSAFTEVEIAAIHRWISEGGRLLLLADHMPFAGAAVDQPDLSGSQTDGCAHRIYGGITAADYRHFFTGYPAFQLGNLIGSGPG